jgi:hypothetical protein
LVLEENGEEWVERPGDEPSVGCDGACPISGDICLVGDRRVGDGPPMALLAWLAKWLIAVRLTSSIVREACELDRTST